MSSQQKQSLYQKAAFEEQAIMTVERDNFVVNGSFREDKGQLLEKETSNPPSGWNVYKVFPNLQDPKFKLEKDRDVLLDVDSALLISSLDKGVGLIQQLPNGIDVPLVFKTKLLVASGRIHLALVDEKGREVYAAEVKAESKWQDLSIEILSLDFDEEKAKLKEIRLYAADPNTSWYTSTVSLANFAPQEVKPFSEGTFTPRLPPYNLRVLFIALNPVENGESLVDHFHLGGNMSASVVENFLADNIISDFQQLSGGKINYQVVRKLNISTFPPYLNGFTYDFAKYSPCLAGDPGRVCENQKYKFDHISWIRDNRICQIAEEEQIDTIWLIAPAYLTTWENFLIGPREGFDVNGGAYIIPECQRHYIINTGGYTPSSESLHISHVYGHATERIMAYYVAPRWTPEDKKRFWEDFTRFDITYNRPSDQGSGMSPEMFCGNIHWPSNGRRHYDYDNYDLKAFNCRDWKNFPSLLGENETINCEKWNCPGNNRWETYWLSTLPDYWWSFLLWPDETIRYQNAGAPIPPAPTFTPTPTSTPTQIPIPKLTPIVISPAEESRCGVPCKPGFVCRCQVLTREGKGGSCSCVKVKNEL